ncbi:oxoglutarate/iron-dependent oxygenase [Lophium mytilinum]|uniref:Oxoglutarate/iron-dependent oxygenase n=1 Tax=Lophium mytilinum TaxID=390894 RepID=A0A6A6QQK9_9PEZI|nr:oxoglutarate/iron-dependent oxygenase [Lophium mytilinum]
MEPAQIVFWIYTATVLSIVYVLLLCFYRLYLSPASEVPGPILAKLTYWYEFYYDVTCGGQYVWKIRNMHEKYGSIIRINPEEVHIQDADYYDEVYTGATRKRDKWTFFTNSSGLPEAAFGTPGHDMHRMRRAAMNPYFSKSKVRSLQPRITEVLDKLMGRFRDFQESEEPMVISLAYAALTNDIAMEYAFGRSDHRMDAPDFDPSFKIAGEIGAKLGHFIKQFPWILTLMKVLPDKAQTIAYSEMATYIKLNKDIIRHVSEIQSHRGDPKYENQTTIFHEILNSDLPAREKTPARLWQDGQVTVIAGTLTTAAALSDITFYLLSQPAQLRKLKNELALAIPDPSRLPTLTALEQLPYLTAVIKEGLRTSSGISTRLQRIAHETLIYTATIPNTNPDKQPTQNQSVLRPGIPLSMTGLLIHHSPTYFKDPAQFRPERWLEDSGLDRYLVPFSRGTRQCVGINLAYAELYLALATVFRKYGSREVSGNGDVGWLELHDTTHGDIEIVGDGVTPLYREGSKGVMVVVRG